MTPPVYLDYNATAPLRPEVVEAVSQCLETCGNPSSVHSFGRRARHLVEEAREALGALIGADPGEIIFTSGGTEANSMALRGLDRRRVLVSAGEHESVLQADPEAERIALDGNGRVDLAALERLLGTSDVPAVVSVMYANNETGILQPIEEVVALAHAAGALVHCDAVQALGKMPIDVGTLGCDLISFSGHKLGAPQGIGALVVSDGVDLLPLLRGGGQERSRRSGTENFLGVVGFGAGARALLKRPEGLEPLAALRDRFEAGLRSAMPGVEIFGAGSPRLPNTSCFGLRGLAAETQVMALDLAGVAVSAGSACSSGKVRPSHVLRAMGVDEVMAGSAIRVSLGWNSKPADLDRCLKAWLALAERCQRAGKAAPSAA